MFANVKKYTAGALVAVGMLLATLPAAASVACFKCTTSTVCVFGICFPLTTCDEIGCPVEK